MPPTDILHLHVSVVELRNGGRLYQFLHNGAVYLVQPVIATGWALYLSGAQALEWLGEFDSPEAAQDAMGEREVERACDPD